MTDYDEIIPLSASIEYLIDRFVARHDVAESSRATYERELRQYARWLRATGRAERLGYLGAADIQAFRDDLIASGKSPHTVSAYLTAVRQLYEWLAAHQVYPDLASAVPGIPAPRHRRKDLLSLADIQRLLSTVDQRTPQGLRDFALLTLLLETGLTESELVAACIGDVSTEPPVTLRVGLEGRTERWVPLSSLTAAAITRYLATRPAAGPDDPLFASASDRNYGQRLTERSISRAIKQALRAAGLDDGATSALSLRHTARARATYAVAPRPFDD